MPTGLPDFSSPVDLALQTAAELIARNKIGVPIYSIADYDLESDHTLTLYDTTGQGKVIAARFFLETVTGGHLEDVYFKLSVDGITAFDGYIIELKTFQFFNTKYAPIHCSLYDEVNYKYAFSILPDLTFENRIDFKFSGDMVNDLYIAWFIVLGIV